MTLASKRIIGLLAIMTGVLVFAVGVTRPAPFKETHTYLAELDSVHGLDLIGRDVRVAGVNVGRLGSVQREGDDALVELVLEKDLAVHSDARVAMRPHTLFEGSSFVDLDPGSPSAPLLAEGERIPIEQTSNYVTLDEALRVLRPEIRERLRDLAATGSRTLRGLAVTGIQRSLRGAPELTRRLKGPARALQGPEGTELAGAIAGAARTLEVVASREADLVPLARRLNRTSAALTVSDAAPLDAALAALPGAVRELRVSAPSLLGLVDRLDRLAVEVIPALPPLGVAVRDATPLVERSIPLLRDATPLVGRQRRIARRLSDTARPLARLIRREGRNLAHIFGGSILPVLLADGIHGEPTYRQLAQLFTAAGAVFRPYQTAVQNPNGQGHVWSLGTYVDRDALRGLLDAIGAGGAPLAGGEPAASGLRCAELARINRAAARSFRRAGGCS